MGPLVRRLRGLCALGAVLAVALAAAPAPAAAVPVRRPPATSPAATGPAATGPAAAGPAQRTGVSHTIGYDHYSLLLDGQRMYLWGAEFHYWRLPSPGLWRDVLQKLKAGGFNAVSIYFDWAYHSAAPGVYDFTGVRDVDLLLQIATEVGIYVVARPGPYINAETDSGGFPAWVDTLAGRSRSSAPDFQAASDEWLAHIDPILARHQYTDGRGTIILYQVENEYGSNTDAGYMAHTEQVIRSHGITVPFTHNHCCGSATWATGTGAVDIPGQDSYPQGFNCSDPARWSPAGTLPRLREDAPVYTPEFQGGAFDPWGGPGYDNCRQLTGPDFEKVFYKNNIASGATMQSFYMTYGGTSWGWEPDPSQVYTSYDYGAAVTESRQLTAKYDEAKRIGYFVTGVAPLAKTDPFATSPPENPAILEQARINPDDGTQFLTLRHRDSTATSTDGTHISIDLGARSSYTWDDTDAALAYQGTWTHVGAEVGYTSGDYRRTESFSAAVGDTMTVQFTGTAVRWISSTDANHGIAEVYLDGSLVATVDGYAASKATQQVFYAAHGLSDGPHTLRLAVTGRQNPAASGHYVVVDAIDVPPAGTAYYPVVPQQPGTALTLAGRDARVLVANYAMGGQRLVYSTSEIMTQARIGDRDLAVLYGPAGQAGETVLRYPSRPAVAVLAGEVATVWDADRGDLRLNYTHGDLARVLVTPAGGVPLLLLIGDDGQAATFWRQQTAAGPVLVRGPHLVRTAATGRGGLLLTGDTAAPGELEVFAPPQVHAVTWNGGPVPVRASPGGGLLGRLAGPAPVTLPQLGPWRFQFGTPESDPAFDDSRWTVADHLTTTNPSPPASPPVLYADDYGFHHGDVWYRARFTGSAAQTGIQLSAGTGRAGVYAAWLNGVYLGSAGSGGAVFPFPAGALRPGADNVLAVLVENMGHNEDFNADDSNKEPRGLTSASLVGAPLTALTWRLQGNTGGEQIVDPVRGPLNVTGLYGQRAGWSLPGYPDRSWPTVSLPHTLPRPGVGWYRSTLDLHLPRGQDTSLGIRIDDDPARHYRAQIYLNGWLIGRYINDLGPQHSFPVPAGILRTSGRNTIAIAVWGADAAAGLGSVRLEAYGGQAGGLPTGAVAAPGYDPRRYPAARPATASVTLTTPDTAVAGQALEVSATLAVPPGAPPARDVRLRLAVPEGWAATPSSPGRWRVTPPATDLPAYSFLRVTAEYRQAGRAGSTSDTRGIRARPQPPTRDSYLSELPFLTATNGWGPVERDTSNGENAAGDGHPITLNGVVYANGLGVHPAGDVGFYLGGRCTALTAVAGVDDEVGGNGSVRFQVLVDGVAVWSSGVLTGAAAGVPVAVDVTGAQQLDLVVDDGGDGNGLDHADWADARVACG
jgi:beta-galactosidase GanA